MQWSNFDWFSDTNKRGRVVIMTRPGPGLEVGTDPVCSAAFIQDGIKCFMNILKFNWHLNFQLIKLMRSETEQHHGRHPSCDVRGEPCSGRFLLSTINTARGGFCQGFTISNATFCPRIKESPMTEVTIFATMCVWFEDVASCYLFHTSSHWNPWNTKLNLLVPQQAHCHSSTQYSWGNLNVY